MKSKKKKFLFLLWLPFAASALLLTVIQEPLNWSLLAWVSVVPFVLACRPAEKAKRLALTAYIVSLCYWLGNLYWIFPITIVGWAAVCFYLALLWPIVALCLRYCRQKKIPLLIAIPVLFVATERLQGIFLGGFFWRFLAHSQYRNIELIQIADIFGTAGVSFLVATVNALAAELIIAAWQKKAFTLANLLKTALVCTAVVAAMIYGRWRIQQSDKFIQTGPLVASLQSNVPQSVKRTGEASDVIFKNLLEYSRSAVKDGAELIIWPETMVQAILNKNVWPFLVPSQQRVLFDTALAEHARDTASVLVGAYGAELRINDDASTYLARYNSAFLYTPAGRQADEHYDKIHLVPFGEVVPFRRKLPGLYNLLMKFTPYNYDYSLDAGRRHTVFEMTTRQPQSKLYKFSVMICYEDTVPKIARSFVLSKEGKKQIHWFVNISNDGWFVRFKGRNVTPSTELAQHTAVCAFRAVENRLAVVRSVNTGISCIIDPLGRIQNSFKAGNLPPDAMKRQGRAGWFADNMPIDKRVTFFCKHGQWLDFSCACCLALLIIVPSLLRFKRGSTRAGHFSRKSNERNKKR